MTTATQPELMTTEQLEALPENDGKDRWLIDGQLREKEMAKRNREHAVAEARIVRALGNWAAAQPKPCGEVVSGEAGFRLRRNPDTTVGIDVAYVSGDVWSVASKNKKTRLIDGVPVVAVEILSPSDKHEEVAEKVATYLECGVQAVWVVDPILETVTVYRHTRGAEIFNVGQDVDADGYLSGFRLGVGEIFGH